MDDTSYQTMADVINAYCNSLDAGQSFVIKQMERKVLNSIDTTVAENDDTDITTNYPQSNVTATDAQIIRAGSITINGVVVQD